MLESIIYSETTTTTTFLSILKSFESKQSSDSGNTPKKSKSNLFCALTTETFENDQGLSQETESYFIHVLMENESPETLTITVDQQATINNLIQKTIEIVNGFRSIVVNYLDYELFMVKKNGQPKYDYPAFWQNQLVIKTGTKVFYLVQKVDLRSSLKQEETQCLTDLPSASRLSKKYKGVFKSQNYHNSLADSSSPPRSPINDLTISENKQQPWYFKMLVCSCNELKK